MLEMESVNVTPTLEANLESADGAGRVAYPYQKFPGDHPSPGYGQCKHCSCGRFEGSSNTCRCGHSFYDHYV